MKKRPFRQASPEIATPTKSSPVTSEHDNIENVMPVEPSSLPSDTRPEQPRVDPLTLLLATGQPLLTKFEEKYLVDLISKSTHPDLEGLLQEKIASILTMNYDAQSSAFRLNSLWIMDFVLKHGQALFENAHSLAMVKKFLEKNVDKNNSTMAFKHWQLQTLITEHTKRAQQQPASQKRRMTVRRIDFR